MSTTTDYVVAMVVTEAKLRVAATKAREWTERRDQMIAQAVADGMSYRTVGEVVGLSHGGIARIVHRTTI